MNLKNYLINAINKVNLNKLAVIFILFLFIINSSIAGGAILL